MRHRRRECKEREAPFASNSAGGFLRVRSHQAVLWASSSILTLILEPLARLPFQNEHDPRPRRLVMVLRGLIVRWECLRLCVPALEEPATRRRVRVFVQRAC